MKEIETLRVSYENSQRDLSAHQTALQQSKRALSDKGFDLWEANVVIQAKTMEVQDIRARVRILLESKNAEIQTARDHGAKQTRELEAARARERVLLERIRELEGEIGFVPLPPPSTPQMRVTTVSSGAPRKRFAARMSTGGAAARKKLCVDYPYDESE